MIEKMLKELDLNKNHIGLSVEHLTTGESFDINGDELFQTASTIKVPILWTLYELINQEEMSLNEKVTINEGDFVPGSGVLNEFVPGLEVTIKDLATFMIIVSDNTATDKLLERIGKDTVESSMRELGLNNTYVRHTIWELLCLSVSMDPSKKTYETYTELVRRLNVNEVDHDSIVFTKDIQNNVMTPNDMTKLLKIIYMKEKLSTELHLDMLDILNRQHFTHRLAKYLPTDVQVGSKTGSLFTVANDVGIVQLPDNQGSYIISAFLKDTSEEAGSELIAHVSKWLFNYFKLFKN
ncbi:serine hydrolase [Bacillaceae bacterium W0354]